MITFLIESQQKLRAAVAVVVEAHRDGAGAGAGPPILIAIAMSAYNYTCLRFIISRHSQPSVRLSSLGPVTWLGRAWFSSVDSVGLDETVPWSSFNSFVLKRSLRVKLFRNCSVILVCACDPVPGS